MSTPSNEEDHWYIGEWKTLKNHVSELFKNESPFLFAKLADTAIPAEVAIKDFVDQVVFRLHEKANQSFLSRRAGGPPSSDVWIFAFGLFGDVDPLLNSLARDAALRGRKPGVEQVPALLTLVHSFLENARRTAMPGSPHRRQKWEAISRASSLVSKENIGKPVASRASIDHWRAVREKLIEIHNNNENYRFRVPTLLEYYDEFTEKYMAISVDDLADVEILMREVSINAEIAARSCKEKIRSNFEKGWEAFAINYELFDYVKPETRQSYMARKGLSRGMFAQLCAKAHELLVECLDLKMSPSRRPE